MLDYADTSAFARAFRRWSGTTPSRWRARDRRVLPLTRPRPRPAWDRGTWPRTVAALI